MKLFDIRSKKANKNRWEALKTLDWERDFEIIEEIFKITNPLFFSSRTTDEIITHIKDDLDFKRKMKNINQ